MDDGVGEDHSAWLKRSFDQLPEHALQPRPQFDSSLFCRPVAPSSSYIFQRGAMKMFVEIGPDVATADLNLLHAVEYSAPSVDIR